MKKVLLLLFAISLFISSNAQQLPQFRFQPFNRMILNPATIGDHNSPDIILNHRSQWVGFEGAPIISTLAGKYPFRPDMAAGAFISNDITGITNRLYLNLNYAYVLKTDKFNISLGLAWTFTQYQIKGEDITLFNPNDAILNTSLTDAAWKPDINAGIYIYSNVFYVGFAAQQLLKSQFKFYQNNGTEAQVTSSRHFYFTGGGIFDTGFGDHIINPFVNTYSTAGTPFKFDIGINYMFQNKFLAALHYANKDALVLQLGYKYNKFQITYAFDIVTSRIRNVSSGAHEISLAAFIFQPNKEIKGNVPSF